MFFQARLVKQIIVAVAAFIIVGGITWGVYRVAVEPVLSPTPDPFASLSPIEVVNFHLFEVGLNDYDTLIRVRNPNTEFGASDVRYEVRFLGVDGQEIAKHAKSFYILPGQTKNIVERALVFSRPVHNIEVRMISARWQELVDFAQDGVQVSVTEVSYHKDPQNFIFSTVTGSVVNNSDFDLDRVDVVVSLIGLGGEPIAVNMTDIRTFLARTTRGFEVSWFNAFEGDVVRVDSEAHTNVFDNDNYIRNFGGQERFQEF